MGVKWPGPEVKNTFLNFI